MSHALAMMKKLEAIESRLGIAPEPKSGHNVLWAWEQFRGPASAARKGTWNSTKGRMVPILEFFGAIEIDELRPLHIRQYLAKRIGAPKKHHDGVVMQSSALQEVKALIAMLNWLTEYELIPDHPLDRIKKVSKLLPRHSGKSGKCEKPEESRVYTEAEIDLMLRTSRLLGLDPLTAVISVMRWSSVRPGELIKLKWANYDAIKGDLMIPKEVAKTGVPRRCALMSDGLAALTAIRVPGSPWLIPSPRYPIKTHLSRTTINDQWKKLREAAGLAPNRDGKPPKLYHLRHTLATRLGFDLGWGERKLADYMGWENVNQARAYCHAQDRHHAEQVREIEAFTGGVVRPPATVAHMSDYVANRKPPKRNFP